MAISGGNYYEFPDQIRMPDRVPQSYFASDRVTHHISRSNPEISDQPSDVIGHGFITEGAIDIRSAPVGLQIDGNYLAAFRKFRQDSAEHIAGAEATVNEDERPAMAMAMAMDLVVHLQTVNGRVPENCRSLCMRDNRAH
jgi:hypothetical protein